MNASENFSVTGFDTSTKKWVTSEQSSESIINIPELDGTLVMDPEILQKASQDQGNYITRMPNAVLQPGSFEDVAKIVRFCNEHDIKVAPQGAKHTTYGQATVENGLAIDLTYFQDISIGSDTARVGAGVLWRDFIHQAASQGVQPASATPDYLGLTIAGTTSVGGFTPKSYLRGNIADNVRSMKVVTGEGELVQCSRTENSKLFRAMQGTLGQFGIIVELEIEITPAPEKVRTYTLGYQHIDDFFSDLNTLAEREEVHGIFGMAQSNNPGLIPFLFVDVEYNSDEPDDSQFLRDLIASTPIDVTDRTYLDRALLFDTQLEQLGSIGWGKAIKSWYDMIVTLEDAPQHFEESIGTLSPSDISPTSYLLLFPAKVLEDRSPYLRVPDHAKAGERVCLIDVLDDNTGNEDPDYAQKRLERNNEWAKRAHQLGGVAYLIGTQTIDWKKHYGPVWEDLQQLKQEFDPRRILIGAHIQ